MSTNKVNAARILAGDFGQSPRVRLLMAINMQGQIQMRRRLAEVEKKDAEVELGDIPDDMALDGFVETKMPLDRAIEIICASYFVGMQIAMATDIDNNGVKRAPYAWVQELQVIKTPIQALRSDAEYGVKRAVDANMANLAHLRAPTDTVERIATATSNREHGLQKARFLARSQVVMENTDPGMKSMPDDELQDLLEEAVVELGISWQDVLAQAAEKHQKTVLDGMESGKVMTWDTELLLFLGPKAKGETLAKVQQALEATATEPGLTEV
jgi:hypothetical protein